MNVKPEDIARIVNWPGSNGIHVFVTEEWYVPSGIHYWRVEALGPITAFLTRHRDSPSTKVWPGQLVWIADDDLRPVEPPDDEQEDSIIREMEHA